MACKVFPTIAKHWTAPTMVRWLWSWCWKTCLHLRPVAKYPVIMWSLFAIFSAGFARKSMGKQEGKVATYYHLPRGLPLISGADWKSCLPKDFRFPLLHCGTENLGQEALLEWNPGRDGAERAPNFSGKFPHARGPHSLCQAPRASLTLEALLHFT